MSIKMVCLFLFFLSIMDYSPAQSPQFFNFDNGTYSNSFPFAQAAGKEVNWLIHAGELNNPSVIALGNKITHVYFRISFAGSRTFSNLMILMAQDNLTSLTQGSFYSGTMDTVYFKPSVTLSGNASAWMQIALDQPFPYDPSKSLILAVGQCGNTGSGLSVFQSDLPGTYNRVWSVGGCPFLPYSSSDTRIVNFGVDLAPYLTITAVDSADASCYGASNGSITITTTGGTGPIQYSIDSTATWQPGNAFPDLGPGKYNVFIKDSIGYQMPYLYNPVSIKEPPAAVHFITDTCCESYMLNDTVYSSSGIYIQHLLNKAGCDSTITLNLTVHPVFNLTENVSVCEGEAFSWHGTDYSTPGSYYDSLLTINGCDSVYVLNLSIQHIDNSLSVSEYTITANENGAVYQWLDCDNEYAIMDGETSQSFTATVNGNYSVAITQGLCSDTSACLQITPVGIPQNYAEGLTVFPNPVTDELTIEMHGNSIGKVFEILNANGQSVYKGILFDRAVIQTAGFPSGIYFIKLEQGNIFEFLKIIKE